MSKYLPRYIDDNLCLEIEIGGGYAKNAHPLVNHRSDHLHEFLRSAAPLFKSRQSVRRLACSDL